MHGSTKNEQLLKIMLNIDNVCIVLNNIQSLVLKIIQHKKTDFSNHEYQGWEFIFLRFWI